MIFIVAGVILCIAFVLQVLIAARSGSENKRDFPVSLIIMLLQLLVISAGMMYFPHKAQKYQDSIALAERQEKEYQQQLLQRETIKTNELIKDAMKLAGELKDLLSESYARNDKLKRSKNGIDVGKAFHDSHYRFRSKYCKLYWQRAIAVKQKLDEKGFKNTEIDSWISPAFLQPPGINDVAEYLINTANSVK